MCNNPDGKIFPGVFARVEFSTAAKEKSILVPTEAIVPFLKGQKVYIVKNGMAEEVVVQTGFRSANKVQIMNGLNDGDSVVVSGLMALKKGAAVKVVGGKKTNAGK